METDDVILLDFLKKCGVPFGTRHLWLWLESKQSKLMMVALLTDKLLLH